MKTTTTTNNKSEALATIRQQIAALSEKLNLDRDIYTMSKNGPFKKTLDEIITSYQTQYQSLTSEESNLRKILHEKTAISNEERTTIMQQLEMVGWDAAQLSDHLNALHYEKAQYGQRPQPDVVMAAIQKKQRELKQLEKAERRLMTWKARAQRCYKALKRRLRHWRMDYLPWLEPK